MKPKTSKLTREQVFERLLEMDRQYRMQDDDISMQDICEKFGWGKGRARVYLDEMVANKEMVMVMVQSAKGAKILVWRVP